MEYIATDTGRTFKPNSVGKYITNIKSILNSALEKKITTNTDFKMKGFKVIKEDVDSVYLNNEEITVLENISLPKWSIEKKVSDLFVIGCYTGLRISDLRSISSSLMVKSISR
jgi:hypothetical protein